MNRRHALLALLSPLASLPARALIARTAQGWELATTPPRLIFPADHHAHPDFQSEWWYFTGQLRSKGGREFGFQLTFFRYGLRPPSAPDPNSEFLVEQLPLAHFVISDPARGEIHATSRIDRGAFGRAGFSAPGNSDEPLVWIRDWNLRQTPEGFSAQAVAENQQIHLQFSPERATHPWTIQGEDGLSRKAPGGKNNSIYYSCTRLDTSGTLRLGQSEFQVSGRSWMDREWSSGLLDPNISGWDWFSLQLRDGRDLMLFQLRDHQGNRMRGGHGTLIEADGTQRNLTAPEFTLTPLAPLWTSPETATRYPIRWNVELPNERLQFFVEARFPEQEVILPPTTYWEGMVSARGQTPGRGYLEMTGYGKQGHTLQGLRGA